MLVSSSELVQISSINIALGSPSTKNLFFNCSLLFLVQSKMVLSINSHVYKLCFIAIKTASILSLMLLKCAATIQFFEGGNTSNFKVISVVKAKVPSLPVNKVDKFIFGFVPPKPS